ncbi:MAG TPA: type II 3-dehydroquinate dehydratase [Xanthomonadales bacterium]|nr:type II 3-dehydroquinate dehydratase [Xanthomonadales bacterium]
MASILVLNGPNLNLLGTREPAVYGHDTLADLERSVTTWGTALGLAVRCRQSNGELALIEAIHAAKGDGTSYIVINPGGFTHTSVALRDALAAVSIPFVEVHLSNVHARESFRRHSYFSDAATGVVCGFGIQGYRFALEAIAQRLGARPAAEETEEIQTGI